MNGISVREALSLLGIDDPPEPLVIQKSLPTSDSALQEPRATISEDPQNVFFSPSMLPQDETIVFEDSSFFKQADRNISLPSPSIVRSTGPHHRCRGTAEVACFESFKLAVKYGPMVTIAEGQCLWAIRHFLSGSVTVSEVYGWCRDGKDLFIYMELVEGETLQKMWYTLSTHQKVEVCNQLKRMIISLRGLKQDPKDTFVGHIGRQSLLDLVFERSFRSPCPAGPFSDVASFHDYLSRMPKPHERSDDDPSDPLRPILPDDMQIYFTHSDLHPSNIMISTAAPGGTLTITIIDWHQAGWLPEYWEYFKALWSVDIGGEWATKYLPQVLDTYHGFGYWQYFSHKGV